MHFSRFSLILQRFLHIIFTLYLFVFYQQCSMSLYIVYICDFGVCHCAVQPVGCKSYNKHLLTEQYIEQYHKVLYCFVGVRVRVKVIGHLYSALVWSEPIARDAQIWPVIARGSLIFTCHPLTNLTCLYSPAVGHQRPLVGTYCVYPWRDDEAELTWVTGYILG